MADDVDEVCARYLEIADRLEPGLVEGLYLQGSVALGDYHPGVSDIDFVAVTGLPPDPGLVRAIHAELRRRGRRPFFDGLYVGWDDLRRDPAQVPAGIGVREWRIDPDRGRRVRARHRRPTMAPGDPRGAADPGRRGSALPQPVAAPSRPRRLRTGNPGPAPLRL